MKLDAEDRELLGAYAAEQAAAAGLPPELVEAVIFHESRGNPAAVSPKGAIGQMQVMPATAADYGADPKNPVQNIEAGVTHLSRLVKRYDGNFESAVAAYNMGEGAFEKATAGKRALPAETQRYVIDVFDRVPHLLEAAPAPTTAAATPSPPSPPSPATAPGLLGQAAGLAGDVVRGGLAAGMELPANLASNVAALAGGGPMQAPSPASAVNFAALAMPGTGRLAAMGINAGVGLVNSLQSAIDTRRARGESVLEAVQDLGEEDALAIGASVLGSAAVGAVLPGGPSSAMGRAENRLGIGGFLKRRPTVAARERQGTQIATKLKDMFPQPSSATRDALWEEFGRIAPAEIDATAWRQAMLQAQRTAKAEGKTLPGVASLSEVQGLREIMGPRTITEYVPALGPHGEATQQALQRTVMDVPTGRWVAPAEALRAANRGIHEAARATRPRAGDPNAAALAPGVVKRLSKDVEAAFRSALPQGRAKDVYLRAFESSQEFSRAQHQFYFVAKAMDPEAGVVSGTSLVSALGRKADQHRRAMGKQEYSRLLQAAKDVRQIQETDQGRTIFQVWTNTGVLGSPLAAAYTTWRVMSHPMGRRLLSKLARETPGSRRATALAGRLTLLYAMLDQNTPAPKSTPPTPRGMPMPRPTPVPAPPGRMAQGG